jgi:hypothetical protein
MEFRSTGCQITAGDSLEFWRRQRELCGSRSSGSRQLLGEFGLSIDSGVNLNSKCFDSFAGRFSVVLAATIFIAGPACAQAVLPTISINGGNGSNVAPMGTATFVINLPSAAVAASTGTLSLQFANDAVNAVTSDPEVTFVSGSIPVSNVGFAFTSGQTVATLYPGGVGIKAGTVAGTISVAVATYAGSAPSSPVVGTVVVPRSAPQITNITLANRSSSGFDVCVVGFSTTRDITAVTYQFAASSQGTLQTTQLTAPTSLISAFTSWFTGSSSLQFGGQFLLDQNFTLSGSDAAIASVTVSLANAAGSVTSNTVPYSGFANACP